MIIIGNLNRKAKTFKVTIDRKSLGIEGKKVQFTDLWNNRLISEREFDKMTLEAARFIAIGIKEIGQ